MGESTDNQKSRLRRELESRRALLGEEALRRASEAVCEQVASSDVFRTAARAVLYAARPGEVDVSGLERARPSLAPFYYPRVEGDRLVFREGSLRGLRPGRFGIPEPSADAPRLLGDAAALIVVPGVAFDARGHRLGTGKGYYDRALPEQPNALRLGVCLEAFITDEIPADPWDVPMDAIATESRFFIVGSGADVPGDTTWTCSSRSSSA